MGEASGYAGKRVIVTGGGGAGMGASLVTKLVVAGAEVFVLDLKTPPVEVAKYFEVNLGNPHDIDDAIGSLDGPIDALFNTVGVPGNRTSALETLLINVAGVIHLTDRVTPLLTRGSAIVTVASAAGVGWSKHLDLWLSLLDETNSFDEAKVWFEKHLDEIEKPYPASKEALIVWTQSAAPALGRGGIRINCTMPGPTVTPMTPDFEAITSKEYWDAYPIPLGHHASPEEQADVLLFLNGPGASCVTGSALITDGGSIGGFTTGRLQKTVDVPTQKS